MTKTVTCDVAVIGLGPAGASAAAAAAKEGLSVIGVDRRRTPGEPVQCAEFVPALLANEAPVAESAVQSITAMHTYLEALGRDEQPNFPGRMISRAAFDAKLAERAHKAGAKLEFGRCVTGLDDAGLVRLGADERIRAPLVIAADGPRSVVGAACGRSNLRLVETRQITAPLFAPHTATDIFLSADLPGGYGWLFPKSDVANIGVGVEARFRPRLKRELSKLHRRLVRERRVGEHVLCLTGGAIPVGGPLDPIARLGGTAVLLAGDAAGLANPVTGAGIAAAVISGALAGAAAARRARGDRGALVRYREELDDLFGASLARAVRRRSELMARHENGERPSLALQRRGWIAYRDYWNDAPAEERAHDLLET